MIQQHHHFFHFSLCVHQQLFQARVFFGQHTQFLPHLRVVGFVLCTSCLVCFHHHVQMRHFFLGFFVFVFHLFHFIGRLHQCSFAIGRASQQLFFQPNALVFAGQHFFFQLENSVLLVLLFGRHGRDHHVFVFQCIVVQGGFFLAVLLGLFDLVLQTIRFLDQLPVFFLSVGLFLHQCFVSLHGFVGLFFQGIAFRSELLHGSISIIHAFQLMFNFQLEFIVGFFQFGFTVVQLLALQF